MQAALCTDRRVSKQDTPQRQPMAPSAASHARPPPASRPQSLLEDHERLKETRERRDRERKEKEAKRTAALTAMRDEQMKAKGFQRLRANQYDELRRRLAGGNASSIPTDQVEQGLGAGGRRGAGRTRLASTAATHLAPCSA